MIENGTDVQKRPCGPGQLASEFGINFGKTGTTFASEPESRRSSERS